jgi:hypothetical protein
MKEITKALKEAGAVLVRKNKHLIWRLPNGTTYVQAASPKSDSWQKAVADIRRLQRQVKCTK